MAQILVRNSLNSKKAVQFNINVKQFTTTKSKGDPKWLLEVATTYLDKDGYNIRPRLTHLTNLSTLDFEIEKSISSMCSEIDWAVLEKDKEAPYVTYFLPNSDITNISSNLYVVIKDSLPSSGIDLSDIKITLNNGYTDFDITNEVTVKGDPYEYTLSWEPDLRVYKEYGD